jgi:hypothetical protein
MNNPALKGEVSNNKKTMESQINPGLRRTNVVLNSFARRISHASEELSRTPEMSLPKMLSQPWMLVQKFKGCNTFKQLECSTNTHGGRHFNEKVDVINSDMQFVDAESIFFSNFVDKPFTISSNANELHRIFGIFGLPNEMESVLSESVSCTSQVHFFTPPNLMFGKFNSQEKEIESFMLNQITKLNSRMAIPLSASKAEVSLPLM